MSPNKIETSSISPLFVKIMDNTPRKGAKAISRFLHVQLSQRLGENRANKCLKMICRLKGHICPEQCSAQSVFQKAPNDGHTQEHECRRSPHCI